MNKNPHSLHKIRFNDCDLFGHLNNARYLDYFMDAREDHLKNYYDFDLSAYYKKDMAWLVGSHEIAYLRAAQYNEQVIIQSTLLLAETSLLHFEVIMLNKSMDQLKSIMRTKLIPVNTRTGKKEQHPAEFLEWAINLENTTVNSSESLQDRIGHLLVELKRKGKE